MCNYSARLRRDGTIGKHWIYGYFNYVCAGTGGKPKAAS